MFKRKPTQRHDRRAACVFIECRSREKAAIVLKKRTFDRHPLAAARLFPAGARASVEPARFPPFPVVLAAFAAAFSAFAAARAAASAAAFAALAAARAAARRLSPPWRRRSRRRPRRLRRRLRRPWPPSPPRRGAPQDDVPIAAQPSVRPASPMSRATCAHATVGPKASALSSPAPASSGAAPAALQPRVLRRGPRARLTRGASHVRPALAALHVRARRDARGDLGPR